MNVNFAHTITLWAKYDAYEIKEAPDGLRYVMPCKDAMPEPYKPTIEPEQMVLDTINTGLYSMRQDEKGMEKAVLRFATKYGLLGLMPGIPTTPDFIDYEKVYLLTNPYIRKEVMETTAFMELFFPFEKPVFEKKGKKSVWHVSDDNTMVALSAFLSSQPQSQIMSFHRIYAERYDWIRESFRQIAFKALTCHYYYNEPEHLDDDLKRLYQKGIKAYDGTVPTCHMALLDKPTIIWSFSSLLQIIQMMMSFTIANDHSTIRLCDQCGEAFISKGREDIFCSEACREAYGKNRKK